MQIACHFRQVIKIDAIEKMLPIMPRSSRQEGTNIPPGHTNEHRHVLAEWSRQINYQAKIPLCSTMPSTRSRGSIKLSQAYCFGKNANFRLGDGAGTS